MSKVNDLLVQLDEAFDYAESKGQELVTVRQAASAAVSAQQQKLDAVKKESDAKIAVAQQASDEARAKLDKLRQQVNERVGNLTGVSADPRVSVK